MVYSGYSLEHFFFFISSLYLDWYHSRPLVMRQQVFHSSTRSKSTISVLRQSMPHIGVTPWQVLHAFLSVKTHTPHTTSERVLYSGALPPNLMQEELVLAWNWTSWLEFLYYYACDWSSLNMVEGSTRERNRGVGIVIYPCWSTESNKKKKVISNKGQS